MCGFLGWFKHSSSALSDSDLAHAGNCLRRLVHRGPDDGHEARLAHGWMGFRRLSIQDLSLAGRQPMAFSAERYTLTFNGEIYNFKELRKGLPSLDSTGDTVVLGELLARQGLRPVLDKLRGMFAFAWWDSRDRSLVLVRDHFGIKPLYYCTTTSGELIYGSELRAVQQLRGGSSRVNTDALSQYLRWGAVQAPQTLLEGIHCLPPGHLLRWQDGELIVERYFTPSWPEHPSREAEAQQLADVRETVLQSIQTHLVSDVPVGVFLSGGLDSTLMAAAMKQLGQQEVQAFSIGYEEGAGVPDESDTAERTARHLGCSFTRERLTCTGLLAELDGYFDHLDQPTGDALNTYLVSKVAARKVKVALSGLGADEWFAGYNHHRLISLAQSSPFSHLHGAGLAQLASQLPAQITGHKMWKAAGYALGVAGSSVAEQHAYGRSILTATDVQGWMGKPPPPLPEVLTQNQGSWLQELLLRETQTYLANTLLRDNDCTSMAHSLELRVPLVDREVFALAGRVSPDMKLSGSVGKRALREAFSDLLPPWIADDRQKKTFTLPLMKWMRHPQWASRIQDTVLSPHAQLHSLLDTTQTRQRVEHYLHSSASGKDAWRLAQPVWMLLVLEEWLQRWLRA
jgi:asparagine synthase (glutamine-hydrolysing)